MLPICDELFLLAFQSGESKQGHLFILTFCGLSRLRGLRKKTDKSESYYGKMEYINLKIHSNGSIS